jgi:hypothetical protein
MIFPLSEQAKVLERTNKLNLGFDKGDQVFFLKNRSSNGDYRATLTQDTRKSADLARTFCHQIPTLSF